MTSLPSSSQQSWGPFSPHPPPQLPPPPLPPPSPSTPCSPSPHWVLQFQWVYWHDECCQSQERRVSASGDGFHSGKGVMTGASDHIPTVGFSFSLSRWQAARDPVPVDFQSQLNSPTLSPDGEKVLIMAEVMSGASGRGRGAEGKLQATVFKEQFINTSLTVLCKPGSQNSSHPPTLQIHTLGPGWRRQAALSPGIHGRLERVLDDLLNMEQFYLFPYPPPPPNTHIRKTVWSRQEKMDIVTTRASNIHLKWVLAKEVSFLMNEPYEAYQTSIFSVSLFLFLIFSNTRACVRTHTHTLPLSAQQTFPTRVPQLMEISICNENQLWIKHVTARDFFSPAAPRLIWSIGCPRSLHSVISFCLWSISYTINMINARESKAGYGPTLLKWGEGSAGLPRRVSHEAEKQFSQTKGYRQGGIFSVINANDVSPFPSHPNPAHMAGGVGREEPGSGIMVFP